MQILSGKLHNLPYDESKTWGSCNLNIQFFRSWILRRWFHWCFGSGCKERVHYSLLSFFTSSSIFLPSHDFAKCLLCIFQNCSPVVIFFLWWYMPVFQLLLGLIQNSPKCGLLPSKYISHWRFGTKILQTASFAPLFSGSDEFETVKYCQI